MAQREIAPDNEQEDREAESKSPCGCSARPERLVPLQSYRHIAV